VFSYLYIIIKLNNLLFSHFNYFRLKSKLLLIKNKMNNKNKIYYLSFWIILWLIYYIWGIINILSFLISLFIYWSIFFLLYFIFHTIKKSNDILNYKNFLIEFIKKISLSFLIIIIFLWFFWYYQNIAYPAKMPQFTITNWKKTVVFQSMAHIWSPDFYENIKKEIIKYKKQWYVYFYEWVKPWTKENMQDFNKALWIQFDKDTYKNFSKLYWVVNQDNTIFLWLVNNQDFNVDLSIDEIIKLYKQAIKDKNKENIKKELPKEVININKEVVNSLATLNEKELIIFRFINKAFLNLIMKNDTIQDSLMKNFSNKTLLDIILEQRNKNIVENIYSNSNEKIFITYWLLHFNWVLELLRQKDPNWKIVSIKYFNIIN
jgi:hypothetical protein